MLSRLLRTSGPTMAMMLSIGLVNGGCQQPAKSTTETTTTTTTTKVTPPPRPAGGSALRYPVTLVRRGGLAGGTLEVAIATDGTYRVTNRGNATTGAMTAVQQGMLAVHLRDFDRLEPAYVGERPIADAFEYQLQYGNDTVLVSDGVENVPATLRNAIDQIVGLAVRQGSLRP